MDSKLESKLHQEWRHCLRCRLSDHRMSEDRERKKSPYPVPLLQVPEERTYLHIVYPCPDPWQEKAGRVDGRYGGEHMSLAHTLVMGTVADLQDYLPWGMERIAVSTALGCRPTSFKDPRKVQAPKRQWIKACRAKFESEVLMTDAPLYMLCGRHALATADFSKATKLSSYIGEVIPFEVPGTKTDRFGNRVHIQMSGYVAPSPEYVQQITRDDQLDLDDWKFIPESTHVHQPYWWWTWHFFYSVWLADTLTKWERKEPITRDTSLWPDIVASLSQYYDTRVSVLDLIQARLEKARELEERGKGVREVMKSDVEDALEEGEEDEDD